jgi:hypothetical protein
MRAIILEREQLDEFISKLTPVDLSKAIRSEITVANFTLAEHFAIDVKSHCRLLTFRGKHTNSSMFNVTNEIVNHLSDKTSVSLVSISCASESIMIYITECNTVVLFIRFDKSGAITRLLH